MIRIAKWLLYAIVIAIIAFLWWFLPKYSFVHKNPQYCVNLSQHLYYCGADSNLEKIFNLVK